MLDDEGMPLISVHALRSNAETTHIAVEIDADKRGNQRELSDADYVRLRPHVDAAITDLRTLVGDLPLHFRKSQGNRPSINCDNWLN